MLRPSPNHGTLRMPNDDDEGLLLNALKVTDIRINMQQIKARVIHGTDFWNHDLFVQVLYKNKAEYVTRTVVIRKGIRLRVRERVTFPYTFAVDVGKS